MKQFELIENATANFKTANMNEKMLTIKLSLSTESNLKKSIFLDFGGGGGLVLI